MWFQGWNGILRFGWNRCTRRGKGNGKKNMRDEKNFLSVCGLRFSFTGSGFLLGSYVQGYDEHPVRMDPTRSQFPVKNLIDFSLLCALSVLLFCYARLIVNKKCLMLLDEGNFLVVIFVLSFVLVFLRRLRYHSMSCDFLLKWEEDVSWWRWDVGLEMSMKITSFYLHSHRHIYIVLTYWFAG